MRRYLEEAISRSIQESWKSSEEFAPGKTRIPLAVPPFGEEEVLEVMDSFLSLNLTMGKKVEKFEKMFADYIGTRSAVMVNSGSSANLLALSVLANPGTENRLTAGDEVITPALTWVTTVYPIVNVGAVPVLVDVDPETFDIDPTRIVDAVGPRTRAIMLVHLLGNPCDMDALLKIAEEHRLFLVEDACEAHGATYRGKRVGSFGDLATFSFFLSHHISTIEGGMVVTSNETYTELARALRAFGWIRDLQKRDSIAEEYPSIDPRFMFINIGFNMRPTEIQGALGIHQLRKLDAFIEKRRENVAYWNDRFRKHDRFFQLPEETRHSRHVYFGYALTIKEDAPFTKEEVTRYLESKLIETRPVMAGNIVEQPVAQVLPHRVVGSLTHAHRIMHQSFFFGNHQKVGAKEREYIADCIDDFIDSRT